MSRVIMLAIGAVCILGSGVSGQTLWPLVPQVEHFFRERRVTAGEETVAALVEDVNADGIPDIVSVNAKGALVGGGGQIAVSLGTGSGRFVRYAFDTEDKVTSVAVLDYNGDGCADLAVGRDDDQHLSIYTGDNTGAFYGPTLYTVGNKPRTVISADLNDDGIRDLAVGIKDDDVVEVLLCDGMGGFAASTLVCGNKPSALVADHLNGDSYPDIVVCNEDGDSISIFLSTGPGTYGPAVDWASGNKPLGISTGDLDADGDVDIAVSNHDDDNITTFTNDGTGGFTPNPPLPVGDESIDNVIADYDLDGINDILALAAKNNLLQVFKGNGGGGFTLTYSFTIPEKLRSIAFADATNDGAGDAVISSFETGEVVILPSVGVAGPGEVGVNVASPVYELGQMVKSWVTGPPGTATFLLFDVAAGNVTIPSLGTFGLAFTPELVLIEMGLMPSSGALTVSAVLPCAAWLDGVIFYKQAVSWDFASQTLSFSEVVPVEIFGGDCSDECDGGIVSLGLETVFAAAPGTQTLDITARKDSATGTLIGNLNIPFDPTAPPALPLSNGDGSITVTKLDYDGTEVTLRFVVDAPAGGLSKLGSNSFFSVSHGSTVISRRIHTSCSQPLPVGGIFGEFLITSLYDVN